MKFSHVFAATMAFCLTVLVWDSVQEFQMAKATSVQPVTLAAAGAQAGKESNHDR